MFLTAQHQEALAKCQSVIENRMGASAIYGDIGAGKTSLARRLLEIYAFDPKYNFALNEIAVTPFGFAEEGIATGFNKDILGSETQKEPKISQSIKSESQQSNAVPTSTPAVLYANQSKILKIALLLVLIGFSAGLYLRKMHSTDTH